MNRNLTTLHQSSFDLIVIGGGIHGACLVWDAALRGLSAALIERGDFGQETSANSLKTVHGGLRYLQDADVGLVRAMIHERSALLRIAPHLVRPLPILMPTYKKLMKSKPVMAAALKLTDVFGIDRNQGLDPSSMLPGGQILSRQRVLDILPDLPPEGVTGGIVWHDGQMHNSERLTLSFIASAIERGAVAANYVEAIDFLQQGDRVSGVRARDTLTGQEFDIRAKVVVNAAGPWIDRLLGKLKERKVERKFHHSLAMNLIAPKFIDRYAAGIPSRPDTFLQNGHQMKSRMLFIAPWRDYSLIGTFHTHFHGNPDEFRVKEEDLDLFLKETNSAYPGAALRREDICYIHHGFLPEKESEGQADVRLVREGKVFDHRKTDGIQGLITVMGVKYTSARRVAARAIDQVFRNLDQEPPKCITDVTPLHDAKMQDFNCFSQEARRDEENGLSAGLIQDLTRNYGSDYPAVRDLILAREPQVPVNLESTAAVWGMTQYAARHEMAQKLGDVILRRTGFGSAGRPSEAVLICAGEALAVEFGWGKERQAQEVEAVRALYKPLTELI